MAIQRTFSIIKPDATRRNLTGKITARFEDAGLRIVASIAHLAHELGMDIVAEGIEEEAQMEALRDLSCQLGQGYFMSKPLPGDEALKLIESAPRW